jgi:acyl carrier protein
MDVVKEIRSFIVENFLFGDTTVPLGEDDSLLQKGLIDSTGILEVVSFIEEKFGIAVEEDELVPDNLDSIGAIAKYVMRKQGVKV